MAYLTHSQYGRNGNEITINNNSNYITGIAGDRVTASSSSSTENTYNTSKGMLASTTGNIYGVYDLSGGTAEYTAVWNSLSSNSNLTKYGIAIDGTVYFSKEGSSDRTKTAYSNGTYEFDEEKIREVCRIGDGAEEIVISANDSWFNDNCLCFNVSSPFLTRGGTYNDLWRRRSI